MTEEEKEFVEMVAQALAEHVTLAKAGASLGLNWNTMYNKIRKLGYIVKKSTELVPLHEYTENEKEE